jgi:hypothetical protein
MSGCASSKLTAHDLYPCVSALWTYTAAGRKSLDNAFMAIEILTHLCDHRHIGDFAIALEIPVRKQKMAAAFDIISLFWNVWHIGCDTRKIAAIQTLQKRWRLRRSVTLCGPDPANDIDPFTLEPLDTFAKNAVFSFWERSQTNSWRAYGFSGIDLHQYIFYHGNDTNPLTRNKIEKKTIHRLQRWHRTYGPAQQNADPPTWITPGVAFTQVVSDLYEFHNIEIQPAWLINLSIDDFSNILERYRQLVSNTPPHMQYMTLYDNTEDTTTIRMKFAREMLYMIRGESGPSYFVCCLVFAISQVCIPLHESLPDWIIDVVDIE